MLRGRTGYFSEHLIRYQKTIKTSPTMARGSMISTKKLDIRTHTAKSKTLTQLPPVHLPCASEKRNLCITDPPHHRILTFFVFNRSKECVKGLYSPPPDAKHRTGLTEAGEAATRIMACRAAREAAIRRVAAISSLFAHYRWAL